VANNNLGIGQTSTVTITFSEAVTGFSLSDLSVANGTLSNLASSRWRQDLDRDLHADLGAYRPTNLIVLDTSRICDAAGNAGAGIAISNNYGIDGERPRHHCGGRHRFVGWRDFTGDDHLQRGGQGLTLSDFTVANGT
jgi:hypothetical protein